MNKKDYMALVDRELKNIKDVIERKNNDYTGDTDSAFANFEVTAALGLSDERMGVLIRMVDKVQRVKTFIQKGELKVKGESAQDAARDICGYALILLGMLEPKVGQKLPLKLQEGKAYLRRDGQYTAKLLAEAPGCEEAAFYDPFFAKSYKEDGKHACGEAAFDLVSEAH